jgi:hypothetical protein
MTNPFFAPMVQAKCAACEAEDTVQRKVESDMAEHGPVQARLSGPVTAAEASRSVQAKCACGDQGFKLQSKLTLGTPGDRFEQEADRTADVVMRGSAPIGQISAVEPSHLQRDGAETCKFEDEKEKGEDDEEKEDPVPGEEKFAEKAEEKPEEKVSPKRAAGGGSLSTDFESRMEASRGGGVALGGETRQFMESRFGYDFSGVRIHTGVHAEAMNRDVRSHAFTSGTDIYFNAGQYRPESDSGRHLLAHELTHVVQQTGPRGGSGVVQEQAQPGVVSRATDPPERKWYYGHRVSGTQVHGELEKILRGADPQKDLVTEAAIPGANRYGSALNQIGVADLYKSSPSHTVTGIKGYHKVESLDDVVSMNSPEVTDTAPIKDIKSSPSLVLPPGVKKSKAKGIKRVLTGDFPESVTLGEIKPADTSKLADGWAQLDHYEQGYKAFVAQISKITGGATRPSITVNRLKLTLPDGLNFDNFETANKTGFTPATFRDRRLWVAEVGHGSGIYLYDDLAAKGLEGQPLDWHQKYWPKLMTVRAALTKKHTGASKMGQGKAIPLSRPLVQRKEPDNREQWEKDRKAFATEFRGELKTKHRNYRDKLRFEKKLGKSGKTLPENQKTEVREYKTMMFWSGFGGKVLGRVRFMLGGVWDKAVEIFEKFKEKMHGIRKKVRTISESKVAGVSWAKRLVNVVVAASKIAVSAFIMESFNFFSDCFQQAMDKVVTKFKDELLNTALGQKLCYARKDYLAFKERLDTEWGGSIKKLEELFELVQDAKRWIDIATTVIDLIRVGVQVISCLTPPALGCLWGLVAQIGIGAALGIVVGTQWFNDNIVTPQVRKLVRVYAAPYYQSLINRALGDNLKEYHCDVSKPFDANNFEYTETGIKAGTKEMEDHRAQWEKENEAQMIADLQKAFVKKDGTPVTKENLQQLIKQIQAKKLNMGQIKTVIEQARDRTSSKIDVDTATQQAGQDAAAASATAGQKDAKTRTIDYPKATRSNLALQKMHGWDPMVFFHWDPMVAAKQAPLRADSETFANAVYDLQEALKIKQDGILGDETLIAFYDRNKLRKDLAYKESVESAEKARRAKEKGEQERAEKLKAARDKAGGDKGKGPGEKPGFKTLDASECKRTPGAAHSYPAGVEMYIQIPKVWDFVEKVNDNLYTIKYSPTHVTVDIFVDHKHVYRIVNLELSKVYTSRLLTADQIDPWWVGISMKHGIELPTEKGVLSIDQDEWSINR